MIFRARRRRRPSDPEQPVAFAGGASKMARSIARLEKAAAALGKRLVLALE